jgi:RimJ/RimL family protein N-acetyltransferase
VILNGGIGLRARHESDIRVLQSELYDDVMTRSRADSRPWQPISPGSERSPYVIREPSDAAACFSVVELPTQDLAGEALLWGIDGHNRTAHLGIALRPAFRGRDLATDVVRALCEYGFGIRGLHRLQIETLSDNVPMLKAATRGGFTVEGTLRRSAWVYGAFADEIILGRLSEEWEPQP